MTEARPSNYWISSTAIYITLNVMGNPDYVQCNVVSNASILCYMKDIKGLGYDAGHNYQRWPLSAAPTFFEESGEKFVYVAIPKSESVGVYAPIVFPSEKVDLYGINAKGEQIGSTDYYYIYLQASLVIETNEDGTQERKWKNNITINTGTLSSDEAINAGGSDSWWKYSSVDDTVEFTKTISKANFEQVTTRDLFFSGDKQPLTGIARDTSTSTDSVSQVVTPKYVSSFGDKYFLSKTKKDTAGEEICFAKGLTAGTFATGVSGAKVDGEGRAEVETLAVRGRADVGGNLTVDGSLAVGDGYGIGADGHATLGEADVTGVRSHGATEGDRVLVGGKGFELYRDAEGKSHLWVDNAMIRGRLVASETEIRKVSYSGGTLLLSSAGSTLVRVRALNRKGVFAAQGEAAVAYKCWAKADDGTTQTMNWWKAGDMALCKTMNVSGTSGGNRYYWRMVLTTGQEVMEDGRLYDYVVLSNLEKFGGTGKVCPVNVTGTLATAGGEVLTWGGMAVSVVSGVEMTSFAEVVKAQLSTDTDDDGNEVADREFYGFDPTGTSVPQEGDVIVQAGNEVAAVRRGGVIKLATSADDADARTAPSLTMYHAVGRKRKTDAGGTSVWQWKTVTAELSPVRSYLNSDYFLFFTGDDPKENTFNLGEKFGNIDSSFQDVLGGLDTVQGDVNAVNGRVDATNKDVSGLKDSVKEMSGQMASFEVAQKGILARVSQVEASYDSASGRLDAVEKQSSEIRQTATEIALCVSRTAVGRTNLFIGSGLRRQGEGAAWGAQNGSGITTLGGYGGTNALKAVVACPAGVQQWVVLSNGNTHADKAPNIRIPAKGAKYTLSCLVKGDDGVTVAAEAFYKAKATDDSSLRKTRLGVKTLTFASDSGKDWQLLTLTVEVAKDAEDGYMEACFSVTHATADATKTAYLCRPMAAQTDGYYGWGWSVKDYDYIGGNMLGGTRLLRRTGNLTAASGAWADGGYGGCTTIKATATSSAYTDMLVWTMADGTLKTGTDYTLSFMAKGTGTVAAYMYLGTDVKQTVETSDGRSATGSGDGYAPFALQDVWTRHTVHWRNTGTGSATRVLIRAMAGTTAEVTQPKLEEGATTTDWTDSAAGFTEDRALGAQLYDTGIDIKAGTIDMTADKFSLWNNAGQKSFEVDAKGDLVARSVAAETADGTLAVTIADGALVATARKSGAQAYFGLRNGLPCLMFTDAMGNVTYTIGANGESSSLQGNGLVARSAEGVYSVSDSVDGTAWVVTYQATVMIENTTVASWRIADGDITLELSGFEDTTLKGVLTSGLASVTLSPNTPTEFTLGKALLSQTIKKKGADGSLVARPTGGRGFRVLYNDKLLGTGAVYNS